MNDIISTEYAYSNEEASHTSSYLWEAVKHELNLRLPSGSKVFDLGCGNGALARYLKKIGYRVYGVDPSETGIAMARAADPDLQLESEMLTKISPRVMVHFLRLFHWKS